MTLDGRKSINDTAIWPLEKKKVLEGAIYVGPGPRKPLYGELGSLGRCGIGASGEDDFSL